MGFTALKSWCQQGCIPFWRLWEKPLFPCLLWLLDAACIPWFMASFSIFESSNGELSSPHMASLWPSLLSSHLPLPLSSATSFHFQGSLWLFWAHPDNPERHSHLKVLNLITNAESPLPCKITYFTGSWAKAVNIFEGFYSVCNNHWIIGICETIVCMGKRTTLWLFNRILGAGGASRPFYHVL